MHIESKHIYMHIHNGKICSEYNETLLLMSLYNTMTLEHRQTQKLRQDCVFMSVDTFIR